MLAALHVGRLFAQGLATPESPLVNVLDIAISIIDSKRAAAVAQPMQQFMQDPNDVAPPRDPPPEAVEGCIECLESLLGKAVQVDISLTPPR